MEICLRENSPTCLFYKHVYLLRLPEIEITTHLKYVFYTAYNEKFSFRSC